MKKTSNVWKCPCLCMDVLCLTLCTWLPSEWMKCDSTSILREMVEKQIQRFYCYILNCGHFLFSDGRSREKYRVNKTGRMA